jgi:hypothetical protein
MKLSESGIKKLIKEAIIDAIEPIVAKKTAINLFYELDYKLKNDTNMKPYYDKLYTMYGDILSGEHFTHHIPDNHWENSNYALLLIESLLMQFPPDKEYERLVRELNEMYDVFYRSESGGYDELYEREAAMDAAQHGHLLNDFLLGNISKLISDYPNFVYPIGKVADEDPSQFDEYQLLDFEKFTKELGIELKNLIMIPAEIMAEDYRNYLFEQINIELKRNQTGRFTQKPLQFIRPTPGLNIKSYHVKTEKGILPILLVEDHGSSTIFLRRSL